MKIAGAILAGGKAKRLNGIAKGNIKINNKTIITNLLKAFAQAGISDVIISANDFKPYKQYQKTIIADIKANSGPLAGVGAVLEQLPQFDAVIFLPCDLPFITAAEINKLKDNITISELIYATTATQTHPLCAAISTNMAAAITEQLDNGSKKIMTVWKRLHAKPIIFADENKFYNINTPALLWVITGSRRGAGKTTLAHRLLQALPHSIYAKYGHGKFNPKKQRNFFNDLDNIHAFIEQHRYLKQHIIIEANALALANIGDITIFIDAPPSKISLRKDAAILKSKADIIIASI